MSTTSSLKYSGETRPALLGGEPRFANNVFVTRPLIPSTDAYAKLSAQAFEARWLTNNGPLTLELEARLRERLGVAFCVSFCNGTAALLTALRALDLDGEVITTPFTFPATPHCIEWNGLTPVFCDVDDDSYNIDPARIEASVGPNTCAILAVHVFGNPCDVDALQSIADRHGLKLVFDAAHAFGVALRGTPIGMFGNLSALSFHATKVFHSAEGGAVVAGDKRFEAKLALLRNFGIVNENEVQGVGLNGKLSELHAAMGTLVLDRLDDETERRAKLTAHYQNRFTDTPGISFQKIAHETTYNYFNFTIRIDREEFGLSRDHLHAALVPERIVARKYFYPLCSENECYASLPSSAASNLPNATRLSQDILSLPLYGDLEERDVDAIVDAVLAIRANGPAVKRALGASS